MTFDPSQLPQRFWYLLAKHELTHTLADNILNILQHIAQHSLHNCMVSVDNGMLNVWILESVKRALNEPKAHRRKVHLKYLLL